MTLCLVRAALASILQGRDDGWVHWLGVQCATWVATSRGSTGRSAANPEGLDGEVRCVTVANFLACRPWSFKVEEGYLPSCQNVKDVCLEVKQLCFVY